MSDCTDPSCGEHINCRRCGDTTNHAPPDFPAEVDGLCPSCAVDLIEAEDIPMPSNEAMLNYLLLSVSRHLGEALGAHVEIVIADDEQCGTMTPVGPPNGKIQQFVTKQCLN